MEDATQKKKLVLEKDDDQLGLKAPGETEGGAVCEGALEGV